MASMDEREVEFLQRLRATFLLEAREHLEVFASGLVALERAPSMEERTEQLETVFRHTHSLKGAARAANFPRIEAICQHLEEVFALCKRRNLVLSATDFDTLHRAFDRVGVYVGAGGDTAAGASDEEDLAIIRQLQLLVAREHDSQRQGDDGEAPSGDPTRSVPLIHTAMPIAAGVIPGGEEHDNAGTPGTPSVELPSVMPTPAAMETIRVAIPHLDRVLLAAEELLTVKQANAKRVDELQRIEHHLDEWGKQWSAIQVALRKLRVIANAAPEGTQRSSVDAPGRVVGFIDWTFGYVKSLEGLLHTVTKSAMRDHHAATKLLDELLDESKNLLMMPFATVTEFLPKLVRDLARDQGKEVELKLGGGGVHLDKRVLEQLKDPLVHLVRNAIDHGIEPPSKRHAADKAGCASLRVEAQLVHGNRVEVIVADDGVGMDPQRLREAAIDFGMFSAEEARQLSDAQAVDLAFRADISTSQVITEISGRGLGLAIVREQVEKLGGQVSIENRAPVGATFRISLPQSLATFRGVFVMAGGQVFVIPAAHVERVARLPRSGLKTVRRQQTLSIDGQAVAAAHLQQILELRPHAPRRESEFITVVLIGGGHERIALAVDEVLHDEEVLVKRLQRPLVRVRNIAGATIMASGEVLPVLNVADLLKSARRAGQPLPAPAIERGKPLVRKVLVAEDSITSRLLLKGILEAEGCEVTTVVDGIEAFTALRSETFDVLVSDIEMPRLDGFGLTSRIRADPKLADLPIILVTALARREDRERGIDVGANAYITKGGFDQRDLVGAIRRLVGTRDRA